MHNQQTQPGFNQQQQQQQQPQTPFYGGQIGPMRGSVGVPIINQQQQQQPNQLQHTPQQQGQIMQQQRGANSQRNPQQQQKQQQNKARHFLANFDYDPSTMSPNPDGCEEELPFQEGDTIKVFCFARMLHTKKQPFTTNKYSMQQTTNNNHHNINTRHKIN